MLRAGGPGRRVLAIGVALLAPSVVLALGAGWLFEALHWWAVNEGLLIWRWSVGWLLATMALSILVDVLPDGPSNRVESG